MSDNETNIENEPPPHNPQHMPSTTLTHQGEQAVEPAVLRPVGSVQLVGPAPAAKQGGRRRSHRKRKLYWRKTHRRKTHRRKTHRRKSHR